MTLATAIFALGAIISVVSGVVFCIKSVPMGLHDLTEEQEDKIMLVNERRALVCMGFALFFVVLLLLEDVFLR